MIVNSSSFTSVDDLCGRDGDVVILCENKQSSKNVCGLLW